VSESESEFDSLGRHLEGIHSALRSLVRHLAQREGAGPVKKQLDLAANHLGAAIREIQGTGADPAEGADGAAEPVQKAPLLDGRDGLMDGLRGTTRSITLSEILGFIATLRKSGVLRVSTGAESFVVQLADGHVVFAQSDAPPPGQRLGEILSARGTVASEVCDRLAEDRTLPEGLIGQRLVGEGLLSQEDLKHALSYQIQCIFHRLFHARGALFQFDEGVSVISPDDVRLNVTSLLLESARSSDEHARDPRHLHDYRVRQGA
jgi:hypothetical protein